MVPKKGKTTLQQATHDNAHKKGALALWGAGAKLDHSTLLRILSALARTRQVRCKRADDEYNCF